MDIKITNGQVRSKFNNVSSFRDMITKRRLLFLDKVMRMLCKFIPARLISVFLKKKILLGNHNTNHGNSFFNIFKRIIPKVD